MSVPNAQLAHEGVPVAHMEGVVKEPPLEQRPVDRDPHGPGGDGNHSDLGGPTPRKRVSQACVPCARRKTKCDGLLPTCSQCVARDITECIYATSRRNKRTRRLSPTTFPRLSLAYDDHPPNTSYNPNETTDRNEAEQRVYQDASRPTNQTISDNQGFAALDALAASASARRSSSIQVSQRQPPARTSLPVSRSTSTRLFKTYFSTIHPMWPILYKPMYDLTGTEYLSDTMPQTLLYAIYSIAACVQPIYDGSEDSYADFPSAQQSFDVSLASLQLQGPMNMLKPSIDTCQTLTILALQQHGVAEDSSAALLCSMAATMALELKLHRAMPQLSDPTENQIRSRLWWSIYVLDKMMAFEMGRPVHLRWEEQDIQIPSASESDEYQLLSLRLAGQNRVSSVKTHTISGFHTTIQISVIMERISRQIYSIAGRTAIANLSRSPVAEEMRAQFADDLKEYKKMMDSSPLKLVINANVVAAPVTITNMVWMWCLTILLHRPYISAHRANNTHLPDPLEEILFAAMQICYILISYADNLPMLSCDLIFPIFTAASVLSHCLQQGRSNEAEIRQQIDKCIGWLRIMGKSWKNASARQEMLARGNHSGTHTPELVTSGGARNGGGQFSDEDWTFLNVFGDANDDFFAMDAAFRDFLQTSTQVM